MLFIATNVWSRREPSLWDWTDWFQSEVRIPAEWWHLIKLLFFMIPFNSNQSVKTKRSSWSQHVLCPSPILVEVFSAVLNYSHQLLLLAKKKWSWGPIYFKDQNARIKDKLLWNAALTYKILLEVFSSKTDQNDMFPWERRALFIKGHKPLLLFLDCFGAFFPNSFLFWIVLSAETCDRKKKYKGHVDSTCIQI